MSDLRLPTRIQRSADRPARDHLSSDDEIERICPSLDFDIAQVEPATTGYQRIAIAFLLASEALLGMTAGPLNADFGTVKNRALTDNETFYDTRHLAITRFAKKFNARLGAHVWTQGHTAASSLLQRDSRDDCGKTRLMVYDRCLLFLYRPSDGETIVSSYAG